ncbi:MAG: hypothetical protein ACYCW6_17830 [Candidatus Xenobia bacterium]
MASDLVPVMDPDEQAKALLEIAALAGSTAVDVLAELLRTRLEVGDIVAALEILAERRRSEGA